MLAHDPEILAMRSVLALSILLLSAVGAFAETTLQITKVENMEFGSVLPLWAGSLTLTAAADGSVTVTASGIKYVRSSQRRAAQFTITGDAGARFYVGLPIAAKTLGAGVTVDTFTVSSSGSHYLNSAGSFTLYVGATLRVASAVSPGPYTVDFDIQVSYSDVF